MNIIVGVSGGIAAYKAPLLVRLLKKQGHQVKCVTTSHALQFVTELTLQTVSGEKVYCDLFDDRNDHSTEHVALKDWGDAMVVAPATANIIGKLWAGIADDALSTLLLAFRKPLWLAPAMNCEMWESPILQRNIAELRLHGVRFIMPGEGQLACGATGKGRMAEPEEIASALLCTNRPEAKTAFPGAKAPSVLLTAGPTYERIDAVRFIGNFSTGKMGFALAEELAERGCRVTLVAGPTHLAIHHPLVTRIDVESAREMYDACVEHFPHCQAAILTAAVADFRPESAAPIKLKKRNDTDGMELHLVQNPDILATLGKMKSEGQRLVGFALESHNELEHAQQKLVRKNLDFIVLNSLRDKGAGFGHDTNRVTILHRDGRIVEGTLKSKREVASDIVNELISIS